MNIRLVYERIWILPTVWQHRSQTLCWICIFSLLNKFPFPALSILDGSAQRCSELLLPFIDLEVTNSLSPRKIQFKGHISAECSSPYNIIINFTLFLSWEYPPAFLNLFLLSKSTKLVRHMQGLRLFWLGFSSSMDSAALSLLSWLKKIFSHNSSSLSLAIISEEDLRKCLIALMRTINDPSGTDMQIFVLVPCWFRFARLISNPQWQNHNFPATNHFPSPKRVHLGTTNAFPTTYKALQLNISVLSKYAIQLLRVMDP